MKKVLALVVTLGALATGGGAAWAAAGDAPPGSTILDVSGDRKNGFTVERYDGSVDYLPGVMDRKAECKRFHHRIPRAKCRTRTWVWYRDLHRLEIALDHAHDY